MSVILAFRKLRQEVESWRLAWTIEKDVIFQDH